MFSALVYSSEIWLIFLNVIAFLVLLFMKIENKVKLTETKPKWSHISWCKVPNGHAQK